MLKNIATTLVATFIGVYCAALLTNYYQRENDKEILLSLLNQTREELHLITCGTLRWVRGKQDTENLRYKNAPDLTSTGIPSTLKKLIESDYFSRYLTGKTNNIYLLIHNMEKKVRNAEISNNPNRRFSELESFSKSLIAIDRLLSHYEEHLLGKSSEKEILAKIKIKKLQHQANIDANDVLKNKKQCVKINY